MKAQIDSDLMGDDRGVRSLAWTAIQVVLVLVTGVNAVLLAGWKLVGLWELAVSTRWFRFAVSELLPWRLVLEFLVGEAILALLAAGPVVSLFRARRVSRLFLLPAIGASVFSGFALYEALSRHRRPFHEEELYAFLVLYGAFVGTVLMVLGLIARFAYRSLAARWRSAKR